MSTRIVLAYAGTLASSAVVAWLRERQGAEVVTVTVDVGQTDDLDEVRVRALACGALRAHVVDARELFVREAALPALERAARAGLPIPLDTLALPVIARTLADVARIEAAGTVAHASAADALDAALAATAPTLHVVAPARTWGLDAGALLEYARARGLPLGSARPERHLLLRSVQDPARAPATEARVEVAFEQGLPVAINGVVMPLADLFESLSLIAGQHAIGHADARSAPAAVLLQAAFAAAAAPDAVVCLTLRKGRFAGSGASSTSELVNHP